MYFRQIIVTGALLSAALAAPASQALAALSAQAVALKASDLPKGFHQAHAQTVSNARMAQASGLPMAQFIQHGRITGYVVDFAGPGSIVLESQVYQYKTAAGAHWDYTKSVASSGAHVQRISAPRIGDESTAFTFSAKSANKTTGVIYGLDFHRGVFDMTVLERGPQGHISINDVVRYARAMDARAKG